MTEAEKEKMRQLRLACAAALDFVENMRITPGGIRDRLRKRLLAAISNDAHAPEAESKAAK